MSSAGDQSTGVDTGPLATSLTRITMNAVAHSHAQSGAAALRLAAPIIAIASGPAAPGGTEPPIAAETAIVHQTVTIIIDAIAQIWGSAAAIATGVAESLIDQPVAVIICAVAQRLLLRRDHGFADDPSVPAERESSLTGGVPARVTGRAAIRVSFVRIAVAVVVESVAHLRCRPGEGAAN